MQGEHAAQRLAFEVQLSTIYSTEIVGRREFYRMNNGDMVWAFQSFDPSVTRTSEVDIFYLTNQNATNRIDASAVQGYVFHTLTM